ncbi:epoxide hydrolase [Cristinia sonorae]|uniref:Epoxide hydrolase n=1 Tax=Cristinia sonorae TaxID=1940300 RepID=A0A8K0UH00_9AGAR|nr:epoxide hydrolase [Cristinia sonorae]
MNPLCYRDLVNSRGYRYRYYTTAPKETNRTNLTLLLVHGFPNTSRDWRLIVPFFEEKGYGVIVPDMLGYGGSDKPTDYNEYQYSLLSRDITDMLDAEGVQRAVAVGHDWGSAIVAHLCSFCPERFVAYAWLNVPFNPPSTNFTIDRLLAVSKQVVGYEAYGYWLFFAQDNAPQLIEENIESFICSVFPKDPKVVVTASAIPGAAEKSLRTGFRTELCDFMAGEEKRIWTDTFLKGGFAAPLCYYKIMVANGRKEDEASIPESRKFPPISSPLFFGAALRDAVCSAAMGKAAMTRDELKNHNVTIKDFDGDHWLLLHPETGKEVNRELDTWIQNVVKPTILKANL